MMAPILLDPSLAWSTKGNGRPNPEAAQVAAAAVTVADSKLSAWHNALAQAEQVAPSARSTLSLSDSLLPRSAHLQSMLRPLAQPDASAFASRSSAAALSEPPASNAKGAALSAGDHAAVHQRAATTSYALAGAASNRDSEAGLGDGSDSLDGVLGVQVAPWPGPAESLANALPGARALMDTVARTLSTPVAWMNQPTALVVRHAATDSPPEEAQVRVPDEGSGNAKRIAGSSASDMSASSTDPEPARLHAEWSAQGVRVWLGADALTASTAASLADTLRRWMSAHGERLQSFICNGSTVYEAPPATHDPRDADPTAAATSGARSGIDLDSFSFQSSLEAS